MIAQDNLILWIVVGAFAAICLVILGLLVRATLGRRAHAHAVDEAVRQTPRDRIWTLAPMGVFALVATVLLRSIYLQNAAPAADLTVTVTGHMWYWTYNYSNYRNFSFTAPMLVNAPGGTNAGVRHAYDHIMVPVDQTVRIVAVATNVIYSWAIPDIGARIEAIPGLTEKSWFKAAKEGRYYGQCSELCGLPHTFKPVEIEVVSQSRFDQWVAGARKLVTASAQVHS
jgi:cytochrome c oxidase subunit 2